MHAVSAGHGRRPCKGFLTAAYASNSHRGAPGGSYRARSRRGKGSRCPRCRCTSLFRRPQVGTTEISHHGPLALSFQSKTASRRASISFASAKTPLTTRGKHTRTAASAEPVPHNDAVASRRQRRTFSGFSNAAFLSASETRDPSQRSARGRCPSSRAP